MPSYCLRCKKHTVEVGGAIQKSRTGRFMMMSKCEDCGGNKSRMMSHPRNEEKSEDGEGVKEVVDYLGSAGQNAYKALTSKQAGELLEHFSPALNYLYPGAGTALQYAKSIHRGIRQQRRKLKHKYKKVPLKQFRRLRKLHSHHGGSIFGDVGNFFKNSANTVANTARSAYNSTIGDDKFRKGVAKGFGTTLGVLGTPAGALINTFAPGVGTVTGMALTKAGNYVAGNGVEKRRRVGKGMSLPGSTR